ncbi:hypothetical protein Syun_007925 [Stephania yunnanensis]|uniref:Uncharacterized protein n=1 Tax=Stephania yunnanensis TaxID=152371 RepID=A0AAP0L1F0_9MAGN
MQDGADHEDLTNIYCTHFSFQRDLCYQCYDFPRLSQVEHHCPPLDDDQEHPEEQKPPHSSIYSHSPRKPRYPPPPRDPHPHHNPKTSYCEILSK